MTETYRPDPDCPNCAGTGLTLLMDACGCGALVARELVVPVPPGLPPLTSTPYPFPPVTNTETGETYTPPTVTVGPRHAAVTGRPATESQMNFLRTLVSERDPADDLVKSVSTALAEGWEITSKQASAVIDKLMKIPKTKPGIRSNSYPGTCALCGGGVPARAGRIEKHETGLAKGKWVTYHLDGECLTGAAKADADADRVTEPGMYAARVGASGDVVGEMTYYRVRKGRYDKTVLWAERAIPVGSGSIVFRKAGRATTIGLKASDRLDWKTARKLGVAYSACINCGRSLSDDRSLVAGYGEVCAHNNHWPYPSTSVAKEVLAGTVAWDPD